MGKQSKALTQFNRLCKQIDAIKNSIAECNASDQARIAVLKPKLKSLETNLEATFYEITESESEENMDRFLRYQEDIIELFVDLENKGESARKQNENIANANDSESKNGLVKLPKLELPNFYGDSETWISFKELFTSSILNNKSLSDLEKLQYLQSCVKGNALKLIRGFPLKAENLQNCWEILNKRFENKRQLAMAQLNKVFMLKLNKVDDHKSLLQLIDTVNESVRNLKTLGLESNSLSDLIFVNFMLTKLDNSVRQRWELICENDRIPDLDMFREFIEREARCAQEAKEKKIDPKFNVTKKPVMVNGVKNHVVNSAVIKKGGMCIVCNQNHALFKCSIFNAKPVMERWRIVESNNVCQNCLRANHTLQNCKINVNCKNCAQRHHTLLHIYNVNPPNGPVNNSVSESSIANNAQLQSFKSNQNVLLATAFIKVRSKSGNLIHCRALLDNGSQHSLISKQCAKMLNLPLCETHHKLIGINGLTAETCLYSTEFEVAPYFADTFKSVRALVVDRVTSPLPNFRLHRQEWPHTAKLLLADPKFYNQHPINVLIGADLFSTLITGSPIHGQDGEPSAVPTIFGHVLLGPTIIKQKPQEIICHHTLMALEKFFELESVPIQNKEVTTQNTVDKFYEETTTRTASGRYVVKLPFKDKIMLGESATHALKLFYAAEKKFEKNPELKKKYNEFMNEYKNLGHMKLMSINDLNINPNYYLPHHAVFNNNSSTTKIRVVFNASAPSSNGISLNDVLLKGPKLQSSIFFNLTKFRKYKIALTADIEKMYRQILVAEEDQHFQRIFWRNNKSEPLLVYQLNTITYGTACAPYLALKTVKQLCYDEEKNFPTASNIAKDHFYMDDFLGGTDSTKSAQELIDELRRLFHAGGFELRKWSSNDNTVLENLPDSLKATTLMREFKSDDTQTILGLEWNCKNDSLQVRVLCQEAVHTKRQLLSVIAHIFDPLGLLSPATIILKILLQEIWKAKLDWDQTLPSNILNNWIRFNSEVDSLRNLTVPRYLNCHSVDHIEFHGFCDASNKAFAAVVYLKSISDNVKISLVAAKTRVAPVKPVTLPKLELCGALLLAELIRAVQESLDISPNVFLWTDSTIALSWILNPPTKGNQFVQHRVAKIRELTPLNWWHHIPGKLNPADCATRGIYPQQLKEYDSWWHGPSWLLESTKVPTTVVLPTVTAQDHLEMNETLCLNTQLHTNFVPNCDILNKFSSYTKTLRIIAWIHRFLKNARTKEKIQGPLVTDEINQATKTIVKLVQRSAFSTEIELLKKDKTIPKSSKLISLNVFLDQEGILRVGGRLRKHPTLLYNNKHPMLMPKNHNITSALIRFYHEHSLHSGPELVLSQIRKTFWIIDGRSAVKKELRKCMQCFRISAKPTIQLMGDLPTARISSCRAFERIGIDFAGPINTKCQHKRKYTVFKSYLCLFICMCTKAVHLELVSELTTSAFLLILKRFISRRGYPSDIFSDNAKTFIGAASYLKQMVELVKDSSVQDFVSKHRIRWHFMPPYGPNFGGLWEASVKLAKRHLIKTCQGVLLNFEELHTLLCTIEACINSRPLVPLSTDPNDLGVLTPGHFLIGTSLIELPDIEPCSNLSSSLFSRWKLLQATKLKFWTTWQKAYLQSLQPRPKWHTQNKTAISPGKLVLLKQPNPSPCQWNLGRIEAVHPGADNLIRVVEVKTKDGVFKRPISQIAVLPEDEDYSPPPRACLSQPE